MNETLFSTYTESNIRYIERGVLDGELVLKYFGDYEWINDINLQKIYNPFHTTTKSCIYCYKELDLIHLEEPSQVDNLESSIKFDTVHFCRLCGWWFVSVWQSRNIQSYGHAEGNITGILRQYNLADTQAPIDEIRKYIERHPNGSALVNPACFEKVVGAIFADFYNCEVLHVGKSKDKGVDLIMIHGDSPQFIQVKRRSTNGAVEGVQAVRELLGCQLINNWPKGVLVTSAKSFTTYARKEVSSPNLQKFGIELKLVDFPELLSMANIANRQIKPYWNDIVDKDITKWETETSTELR